MYKGLRVGVVVPAYNEEKLIGKTIESVPGFVDRIFVVDDCSRDRTSEITQEYMVRDPRVLLLRHEKNQGVGGAIMTGHTQALREELDAVAIMAGDAQMDPADLPNLLDPIAEGKADYTKGNRFAFRETWEVMPRIRYFANAGLSMLNKIASGYWHISDPQMGYTVISRKGLQTLDLKNITRGYQFENSMLLHLNVHDLRVVDVPVKAIYGIGEKSGISHWWALWAFSIYLLKAFFWRLKEKYIIRDFHPLVFFYAFGMLLFPAGLIFGLYLLIYRLFEGVVSGTSAMFAVLLFTTGLQFLLFAMWFDKDYTDRKR